MPSAKCSISHAICYSALLHLNFACVCGVSLGETLFRTRVPVPSSDLRRLVFGLVLDFGFDFDFDFAFDFNFDFDFSR